MNPRTHSSIRWVIAILTAHFFLLSPAFAQTNWRSDIQQQLPLLGEKSWIVVADNAYPWLKNPNIYTVYTGDEEKPMEVLQAVLEAVNATAHLRATIYTDAELPFVTEQDAPGIEAFRKELKETLATRATTPEPRATTLNKVAEAGERYHVLILKTCLALPYGAVSFELDSKYLTPELAARVQAAAKSSANKPAAAQIKAATKSPSQTRVADKAEKPSKASKPEKANKPGSAPEAKSPIK